ncbi:MAG: acireductone synthase [Bacteriovoracaceae bacterium]|nr:acireductone synthase [Bacteriovoracaceae bacterium]
MIKFILMDVEGTTTSKDFVYETLFPYAYAEYESFIKENIHLPAVQEIVKEVAVHVVGEDGKDALIPKCLEIIKNWAKNDLKIAPLKKLQGMIWEAGYKSGKIFGHVYPEVKEAYQDWTVGKNLKLGIYSSGSVLAQKMLFKYSMLGDLTPYLSFHFDTSVGNKREKNSYSNIANALNLSGEEILFLSDTPEELEAAQEAKFRVLQIVRDEEGDKKSRQLFKTAANFNFNINSFNN